MSLHTHRAFHVSFHPEALRPFDRLRAGCNRIGDDGCKALAEGLKSNKTLTSLDASCELRCVRTWTASNHALMSCNHAAWPL
eukprot:507557-Pleurochrysis_carterae.AAC.5